jgi:hypothetical protein
MNQGDTGCTVRPMRWAFLVAVGCAYILWIAQVMAAPGLQAYQQDREDQLQNVQRVTSILNARR